MALNLDKTSIRQWLIRWMVKLGRVKSVTMSADEINALLGENLPETFNIPVPGAKGEVIVQTAKISMPPLADHFVIHLFCALNIDSVANPIYRAHVDIEGVAWPAYNRENKQIFLTDIKVGKMTLIQDEYSLLKDTRQLMNSLVPEPIRSVFGVTVKTTLNVLSRGIYKDAKQYLSLYMLNNKQKILDYHKPDLEKVVKRLSDDAELNYYLDEHNFEEQLFAEFGKAVIVKNGELQFIFRH
ncbi:hypothetical protein [Planctobacterium marinum]|uniref:DUF1439 domain-containing protein n=1 Tax=Planctobacterium marinum TaxID=1631968 RepID=A0AA48HP42_9ALTE|nr:hypothetical protein MACH26_16230 [Planctobacterium marinum]